MKFLRYLKPRVIKKHVTKNSDTVVVLAQIEIEFIFKFRYKQISVFEIKDGLIEKHDDIWDIREMINSLPIVSYFYQKIRQINGYLSSRILEKI